MSTWKRDFASGLIVLVPLIVLLLVLRWIYRHLASIPLIGTLEPEWMVDPVLPLYRVVISLAVFTTLVLAVGYFMRTTMGRIVEDRIDETINRLPALRVVYNASKLAVETALQGTDELQKPVHIQTWEGLRMTAFKTGKKTRDGRIVLFMPTAPNITTGFVIEVDPDRVSETGETVEEAMTRVLSAGFAESAHQIPVQEERPPGEEGQSSREEGQSSREEGQSSREGGQSSRDGRTPGDGGRSGRGENRSSRGDDAGE